MARTMQESGRHEDHPRATFWENEHLHDDFADGCRGAEVIQRDGTVTAGGCEQIGLSWVEPHASDSLRAPGEAADRL